MTDDGPVTTVALQSPGGLAFALVTTDDSRPAPAEVADEALTAMREEYPNLDATPALETINGHNAVGHDVEFISLDMTNTCAIRCFRTPRRHGPGLRPVVGPRRELRGPHPGRPAVFGRDRRRIRERLMPPWRWYRPPGRESGVDPFPCQWLPLMRRDGRKHYPRRDRQLRLTNVPQPRDCHRSPSVAPRCLESVQHPGQRAGGHGFRVRPREGRAVRPGLHARRGVSCPYRRPP